MNTGYGEFQLLRHWQGTRRERDFSYRAGNQILYFKSKLHMYLSVSAAIHAVFAMAWMTEIPASEEDRHGCSYISTAARTEFCYCVHSQIIIICSTFNYPI
jgi:hypothetical protein